MSDVQRYINHRVKRDKAFAKNFETGYTEFKTGISLRQVEGEPTPWLCLDRSSCNTSVTLTPDGFCDKNTVRR